MSTKTKNDLIALLVLMKRKAADAAARNPEYEPVISTHRVVDILRSSGTPFSYSLLSQLKSDPAVGVYIADLNKDQLTINLEADNEPEAEPELPVDTGMEEPAAEVPPEAEPVQSGEAQPADSNKVDQMAKRALKRL